jgi:hypothetical protein
MKKRILVFAVAAFLALTSFAQKAYRAPLMAIAKNTVGGGSASFVFSNYAEMGDAGVEVVWFSITASTNVALYTVQSGGTYSNLLFSADLTEATTTNFPASASYGIWPASDTLLLTVASTNDNASARLVLKVTK